MREPQERSTFFCYATSHSLNRAKCHFSFTHISPFSFNSLYILPYSSIDHRTDLVINFAWLDKNGLSWEDGPFISYTYIPVGHPWGIRKQFSLCTYPSKFVKLFKCYSLRLRMYIFYQNVNFWYISEIPFTFVEKHGV